MTTKIEKELETLLKIKQKDDEKDQAYFRRLFDKAAVVSDVEWEALSEPTQKWVNAASKAVEDKEALPNFDGEVTVEKVDAEANVQEQDGNGEDVVKSVSVKKKAPAGKKVVAKKAPAGKKVVAKKAVKGNGEVAAKKSKVGGETRGRKGLYPLTAKITLKSKENPHRDGTLNNKMYSKYKSGMTVQQALNAGVVWANLRYLAGVGHIKIS